MAINAVNVPPFHQAEPTDWTRDLYFLLTETSSEMEFKNLHIYLLTTLDPLGNEVSYILVA